MTSRIAESDVERCEGHFDGVNVKLVKCGGLTPAAQLAAATAVFDDMAVLPDLLAQLD